MTQTNLLKKAVLLSGVAIIAFAATAHAGFEWKGPLGAPAPAAEAAPVDTQPNDDLTPVTSWEKPADEPAAMPAPVTSAPMTSAPVKMSPSIVDEVPAPVTAAPASTWTPPANDVAAAPVVSEPAGDVLSGFGSDVPLVIALQQIVPPGYQYSFAAGVNPGVSVSWEGGKSWQQVLADTLASHGLGFRLKDNAVVIGNYASDVPAQQAAAPEAAPAASDASLGMSSVPQEDTAPVAITSTAPDTSVPAETASAPVTSTVISEKPVTIHREKRSSLLERLGWTKGTKEEKRENIAVPSETASTPAPSWSAAPEAAPANDTAAPAAPVAPEAPNTSDAGMSADPMPVEESSSSNEPQQLAAAKPYSRSAADAAMSSSATEVGATTATPVAATGNWNGAKGQTLRDVLKTWSDKAGVELYWSIDYDYRLSDDISSTGSYDQAVGGLLDKFASVRPQPYGQLHQSASGPRVLVVKSYDLTR